MGCVNSVFVHGCARIDEKFLSSQISVYPNPTNGSVTISYENFTGSFDFTVTTLDGKIVRSKMNSTDASVSIDLSQEPNGVYLIHIESGEVQRTLKVVKD